MILVSLDCYDCQLQNDTKIIGIRHVNFELFQKQKTVRSILKKVCGAFVPIAFLLWMARENQDVKIAVIHSLISSYFEETMQ